MRKLLPCMILLLCFTATPAEARPFWQNATLVVAGGAMIAAGICSVAAMSLLGIGAAALAGVVALGGAALIGVGVVDQLRHTAEAVPKEISQHTEIEQLTPIPPLPSVEEFLAGSDKPPTDTAEARARREQRRQVVRERRQAKRTVTAPETTPRFDFDVDDDSYDWCLCAEPSGVFETAEMVSFLCSKCLKVNREYARKALALEQRLQAQGKPAYWQGPNAEANARRAAKASD